ncbi:MAG: porin family protein [Chitinophagales bacterium]|nr:PorT family protein [Chitinophagales bacterium]MDW8274654.1 porin family protein [Chitinophagales bacterium]
MNKVFWLLFCFLTSSTPLLSQNSNADENAKDPEQKENRRKMREEIIRQSKLPKDRIAIDLLGTNWIHRAGSNLQTRWYSRGINVYFYYDFRIKKSRFSIAPGIGYGAVNIYHRSELIEDTTGISFKPISADKIDDIRVNKVTLQYLDIPVEFRIRTNPDKADNFWKFALGFKAGIRLGSHTKQTIREERGTKVYVERRFPDFSLLRAGPTLRIGYSVFNITGYFGVLEVFKQGRGPKAHEFAVGISFNGL